MNRSALDVLQSDEQTNAGVTVTFFALQTT
jgi:hypothetical protein